MVKTRNKQGKNHVKSYSNFHFLIYMSMWCPSNGILIMASCVLWLIWMLKNLNWIIGSFDFEFWFQQRTFKVDKVFCQTLLVSQRGLGFSQYTNSLMLIFFAIIGEYYTHKKNSKYKEYTIWCFSKNFIILDLIDVHESFYDM